MPKSKLTEHNLIEERSELSLLFEFTREVKKIYPWLYYRIDFAAGLKLPPRIAGMQQKLQKSDKYPDIFFPKPIGAYCGLYIEFKTDISEVFLVDGFTMVSSDHIRKQWAMLQMLRGLGYKTDWGFGVIHSLEVLNNYLSGQS